MSFQSVAMALPHDFTLWFSKHEERHPVLYFWGRMTSGSLMVGASVVYPLFSELGFWAVFALLLFFPSWGIFNAFQISRILINGHYTVVASLICLVVVIVFGPSQLSDHIPWLPVYATSATLLTFCWDSLGTSWFRLRRGDYAIIAMDDMDPEIARVPSDDGQIYIGDPPSPVSIGMDGQAHDLSSPEDVPAQGSSDTDEDPSASDLFSSAVGSQDVGFQETAPAHQLHTVPIEFEHMGGMRSDIASHNVAHSDSSIALSSRSRAPLSLVLSSRVLPRVANPGTGENLRRDFQRIGPPYLEPDGYPAPRSVASSTRPVVLSRQADAT